jgi:hypothetical protein
MNIDAVLARLQNVHRTGPQSWRAACPNGHEHARDSLSLAVCNDDRILVHCFACLDTYGALAAIGLTYADLYPVRIGDTAPITRASAREALRHSEWSAAIRVVSREACVAQCAAAALQRGNALTADDTARLALAIQRIELARELLG